MATMERAKEERLALSDALFARLREPDGVRINVKVRDQLEQLHLDLARKIAHKYARKSPEPYEDLEQLARMGLLKAIDKFDLSKGFKFSSFAVTWIRGSILHHLRDNWSLLKVKRENAEKYGRVCALQRRLAKPKDPRLKPVQMPLDKIAAMIGIEKDDWEDIKATQQIKHLLCLEDLSEALPSDEPEQSVYAEHYGRVLEFLGRLDEPTRSLVIAHHMHDRSLDQLSTTFNIPQSEVQELLSEGLDWLRYQLEA